MKWQIVHNRLRYHKVCARCVPKQLTMSHKQTCSDICQQHLDCCGNECGIFLDRICTGDETWIHRCKLESKRQSMGWKHGNIYDHPVRKSSEANHLQENLCLQFFGTHKAQYWNIIRRSAPDFMLNCM
jgi:hypothetical protein